MCVCVCVCVCVRERERERERETRYRLAAYTQPAAEFVGSERHKVMCAYITACVCVCVFGNLYPYHHIGERDMIRYPAVRRIGADIPYAKEGCSKTLTNQHGRSNPPIRLEL